MYNLYRIAAVSPDLHSADVIYNFSCIADDYQQAVANGASLVLFPAMAATGKSCGVLFQQPYLLTETYRQAEKFAALTGNVPAVFGLPVLHKNQLTECAAVAQNGKIAALVVRQNSDLPGFNGELPDDLLFVPAGSVFDAGITFSVEFAGDMPADSSAMLRLFCGAEAELPGAWQQRENFFRSFSGYSGTAYAAAFAGCGESTGDQLYGGALLICNQGKTIAQRPSPATAKGIIYADIDADKIVAAQLKKKNFPSAEIGIAPLPQAPDMRYLDNPQHPFLPKNEAEKENFCRESFALQCIGLKERFIRCRAKKMILGISGGLDSTLALVAMYLLCRENNLPMDTIIAVTMPGFGTTGRTKNNALKLAEIIGAEIREIPIAQACLQHFSDIGHDPQKTNSVYENSQARERTQILMDIANAENGIVIGTGDLSEIALGWSTFNGDQMAMYAINSSIPKSNIAAMLKYAAKSMPEAEKILQDVIDTPVSPELLPLDENGEIAQRTENILGAYELHDFYLYHFTSGIGDAEKLLALARNAFDGKYPDEELCRVRELFMRRFFTQQFKRTAGPDGIQAGIISLSARNAWQMPADINGKLFISKE